MPASIALFINGSKYFFTSEICGGLNKKTVSIFWNAATKVEESEISNLSALILYSFILILSETMFLKPAVIFNGNDNLFNDLITSIPTFPVAPVIKILSVKFF